MEKNFSSREAKKIILKQERKKRFVALEFVKRSDTYNLGIGGEGGPHFKGKTHSKESIEQMVSNKKGFTHSVESKKKISEANKGKVISDETRKKLSEKAKLKKDQRIMKKFRDYLAEAKSWINESKEKNKGPFKFSKEQTEKLLKHFREKAHWKKRETSPEYNKITKVEIAQGLVHFDVSDGKKIGRFTISEKTLENIVGKMDTL